MDHAPHNVGQTLVVCVKHRDGWCALKPHTKLDPDALQDHTACGYVVTLRTGSEVRTPTCPQCLATLTKTPAD